VKRRGRPVLGAVSGLIFGLMVGLDLTMFKVRALDAMTLIGLPVIGLALGIVIGVKAPFGKKGSAPSSAMPAGNPVD
jgi:hypothetical protein